MISLLSTLCRGSPAVTHELLRSQLPDAIESALHGDDRCVLDTMRLVDLLLVLLVEGRKALPKCGVGGGGGTGVGSRFLGLRRMDSAGERSHRQLIDCIRHKDTDALIDAIDCGSKCLTILLFHGWKACSDTSVECRARNDCMFKPI